MLAPWGKIKKIINIPREKKKYLPRRWELIGKVLILKIPEELRALEYEVGKTYAETLGAETVVKEVGGISGEYREPNVKAIYGKRTETMHLENGVKFKLDVAKLMFSSGNVDERIRMATIAKRGEIIVDMFAGIGYFCLPIAVHSKPQTIYAFEKNPLGYRYLKENIRLNRVEKIIIPHPSDNRNAPENVADRVIMGYLHRTHEFLPKGLRILRGKGIIHYHENCPTKLLPTRPWERANKIIRHNGKRGKLINIRRIKSYAPGVTHVVLDLWVG